MDVKFSTITDAVRTAADEDAVKASLTTHFSNMDDAALSAALSEGRETATALFAKESPTVADADEAEVVVASINALEAEEASRTEAAAKAAERFSAAQAKFAADNGDTPADSEDKTKDEKKKKAMPFSTEDEDPEVEDEDPEVEDEDPEVEETEDGEEGDGEVVTAATRAARGRALPRSAARKVGGRKVRPEVKASTDVVITAAADVGGGFATGQRLKDMREVAKATQARVKNFAPFNLAAARAMNDQTKGAPALSKFGVASFAVPFEGKSAALTASSGVSAEYDAVGEAVKNHVERLEASLGYRGEAAMSAAMAWCSPSEVVYNWVADFVVDGLKTLPEINAPRGGLMLTEGPRLLQDTYGSDEAVDGFGFGGTEAEMEAGYIKQCETIECPEFVDHRLDFDGYCWKIPILTEKSFPELVADAMRASEVLYAHKINRRTINDIIAESTAVDASMPYGGSVLDTLEALVQVAVKERRWWNLGENAIMEVTLPQHAREIFKFDMARRSGLALNDVATDQKIAAYFSNHRLAVDYVSDFDSLHGSVTPTADWPGSLRAIIYPAGTFVQAKDDVINLSAVYDAASLSQNEYTGVFYEQGIKTIKRGYRSHVVTIPVCTAGTTGANAFLCDTFYEGSL